MNIKPLIGEAVPMLRGAAKKGGAEGAAKLAGITASAMRTPADEVIVVGGGVAGLYNAIAAVKAGFNVTVVEKYGRIGTRKTIFNLAPTVADSLARLEDGKRSLVKGLQTIVSRSYDDEVTGVMKLQNEGRHIVVRKNPTLTAESMANGFEGLDHRPWSRAEIAGLENFMRGHIEKHYPQVRFMYDTVVDGISQTAKGVSAHAVDRATGTVEQTIEGAFLVSATGGRNVLGRQRSLFPEKAHFVGGLAEPVPADQIKLKRLYIDGAEMAPDTQKLNPPGRGWATVGLPGNGRKELPNSLVWAQIADDAKNYQPDELRAVVRDRLNHLGIEAPMLQGDDALLKVNVQLGLLQDSAVEGRVILAGDELLSPYFPTSTGASHALGVNGPIVADTLKELRAARGMDEIGKIMSKYDEAAHAGAKDVMRISHKTMIHDLGFPAKDFDEAVSELGRGVSAGTPAP